MFYEHTYKNKQIDASETMNSYEACFVAQIIRAYVSQYKKKSPIHFVDIGTGQGISSIVVLNELLQMP
jgi:16S rRNA G527 N7-methylase RsmG